MDKKEPIKSISNLIVFVSVFVGTLIGEGINVVSDKKARKGIFEDVKKRLNEKKKAIENKKDFSLSRIVEIGAQQKNRIENSVERIYGSFKRAFEEERKKASKKSL